ncbi:MAG TPA: hypothetical protein VFR02_10210 [bacterium]|nr:hypothetical protein [bacterium]
MTYTQFERWLERLAPRDLDYLKRHKEWAKEYEKARRTGILPAGFPERTMEVLEDGSDSET